MSFTYFEKENRKLGSWLSRDLNDQKYLANKTTNNNGITQPTLASKKNSL